MFFQKNSLKAGIALSAIILVSSCNEKSKGGIVQPLSDNTTIITYKGGSIKAKDVNDRVKSRIQKFNSEAIEIYQRAAEGMVVDKLLEAEAKKQGLKGPKELLDKMAAAASVTDAEVDKFYEQSNLAKGYKDPKTGKVRQVSKAEVKKFLEEQSKGTARQSYMQGLIAKAEMKVVLEEPRVKVPLSSETPVLGNRKAKVMIHEFSDFQCPFCSRGKDTVAQIHQAYGDKVGIAFHHLPLDFHKEAMPSAIASTCAGKQGKFWEYHDLLFDNQRALASGKYLEWAKQLKLNEEKFTKCLSNPDIKKYVQKDLELAKSLGAQSTPTFFINGKKVAGALPFAQFKQMIDQELR